MTDQELLDELILRDYDSLTDEEKAILEQLIIEDDAEAGYFEED